MSHVLVIFIRNDYHGSAAGYERATQSLASKNPQHLLPSGAESNGVQTLWMEIFFLGPRWLFLLCPAPGWWSWWEEKANRWRGRREADPFLWKRRHPTIGRDQSTDPDLISSVPGRPMAALTHIFGCRGVGNWVADGVVDVLLLPFSTAGRAPPLSIGIP